MTSFGMDVTDPSKSGPPSTRDGELRQRGRSRFTHRSRNHATAHADEAGGDVIGGASSAADHPLVPRSPATLVTTDHELAALLDRLRRAGSFAYDSEFIGELTYFPKLCLIQTASTEEIALIDPLAQLNLQPFWELLCDASVRKIVHAGQQDIEPVIRHMGVAPANLFDTQIAAGFIGMPYPVSLSKLVLELAGARLGKGLTFTHWDQRPLSEVQLRYAADDVRYLPRIYADMMARLKQNGHVDWMQMECDALCDTSLYRFDPQTQYLRVRGASGLLPRNLAVLRALTSWRDGAARADDLPPRSFLKDEILIELSRNPVKSVEKLDRVRGLPRPVEIAHGPRIVQTTLEALALAPQQLPAPRDTEQSPLEKFRTDALWAAVQCLCAGQQVDPALVTNRQDIADFYRAVQTGGEIESHGLMSGWRRDALGKPLLALLRGDSQLNLTWSDGQIASTLSPR